MAVYRHNIITLLMTYMAAVVDAVASSAVSIDFTAISTNLAVSYDEEGVVLPRG
jgi:hypothetical protein